MKPERIVWLVNHYALPPGSAGGTRHYTLAKRLRAHGWRAIVIAGSTELNQSGQRLARGERHRFEMVDGVEFLWLRTPAYRTRIERLRNMLTFARRLAGVWRMAELPRPEAVVGSSPQPFAAFMAWMLALRYRARFYYEVRDLWPEGLTELGNISPHNPLMLLFRGIERWLSWRARAVITLLPGVKDYFLPRGVKPHKLVWVPNGIDSELFADAGVPPAREGLTLMYFGAHGLANRLQNLLDAMALLEREGAPGIALRLVGDGPLKAKLVAHADALGLKQLRFEDAVPKQQIPVIAAQADAFVFNLADAPVFNKYGISSNKLFDFMAAARPVLFCCRAGNNPVAQARAGITVEPQNPAALAAAIRQLAATSLAERQAMGARGRAHALAHHSFDQLALKFKDVLER